MRRFPGGAAVAVACLCSGLLFLARGSYMPYFFPLYQGVFGLDYAATAVLLNIYLAANSFGSPFVGLLVDRWTPVQTIGAALGANLASLGLALALPAFASLAVSVAVLGVTFTMGRVAFNKLMIGASDEATLRRSVSIRAMLMTGGSFVGNVAAAWFVAHGHAVGQVLFVYAVLCAAWLLSLAGHARPSGSTDTSKAFFWSRLAPAARNRHFLGDLFRLAVALLPYGCWGTVIPKYVMDRFADPALIPAMYACSTAAVVGLTYVFNQVLSPWCHRRSFPRQLWPFVSAGLFLLGLLAIACAHGVFMLCLGALAFGLGEVIFTPCMDEASMRNATPGASGTYIGLVQFTEGGARLVGSTVALGLYGVFRSSHPAWAWVGIIGLFSIAAVTAFLLRQPPTNAQPQVS
jgi:MFS family permease